MTEYTQKTFTVPGPKTIDKRRDCNVLGHWRITLHGKAVCYWCHATLDESNPSPTDDASHD